MREIRIGRGTRWAPDDEPGAMIPQAAAGIQRGFAASSAILEAMVYVAEEPLTLAQIAAAIAATPGAGSRFCWTS